VVHAFSFGVSCMGYQDWASRDVVFRGRLFGVGLVAVFFLFIIWNWNTNDEDMMPIVAYGIVLVLGLAALWWRHWPDRGMHFKHFVGEVETAVSSIQSALTRKGVEYEIVEDKQRFTDKLFNRELHTLYLPKSGLYLRVRSHRFRNSAMLGITVEIGAVTIQNQSFVTSLKKRVNTALT